MSAARYLVTFEVEADADISNVLEAAQLALPVMVLAVEDMGGQVVQATEDDVSVEVKR
jgi:hypothetical protein